MATSRAPTEAGAGRANGTGRKRPRPPAAGVRVLCRWRDDRYYEAEVLEVRDGDAAGPACYVHYLPFDRRLDEWVRIERLDCHSGQQAAVSSPPPIEAPGDRKTRNPRKACVDDEDPMDPESAALEKQREEETRVKNLDCVVLGQWEMEPWYYSPFAPRILRQSRTVIVCEWCLKYMRKSATLAKHLATCTARQPPGLRIYRHEGVSVFEVDGATHLLYCQCLCLLAKLFLDHKTLYFDVAPFRFYVMTRDDDEGSHLVGYFSKEKLSLEDCNVACILTLPPYQGQGYGRALIQLSYELTKREGRVGSPERPLSDLGRVGYLSFWRQTILGLMWERREADVKQLSVLSGIACDDIVHVLATLGFLTYYKGEHRACASLAALEDAMAKTKPPALSIDPQWLLWNPHPAPSKKDLMRLRHQVREEELLARL